MMEVDGDDDGANLATFGLRREPALNFPRLRAEGRGRAGRGGGGGGGGI